MSYRDGTSQYVPPGYERMDVARDRIGADIIRDLLATDKMQAFVIHDATGELSPISTTAWVSENGTGMLHFGYWAPGYYHFSNGWRPLDYQDKDRAELIIVKINRSSTNPALKVSLAQVRREILQCADGIKTEPQVRAEVEIRLGHITNGVWRPAWREVPFAKKRQPGARPR